MSKEALGQTGFQALVGCFLITSSTVRGIGPVFPPWGSGEAQRRWDAELFTHNSLLSGGCSVGSLRSVPRGSGLHPVAVTTAAGLIVASLSRKPQN